MAHFIVSTIKSLSKYRRQPRLQLRCIRRATGVLLTPHFRVRTVHHGVRHLRRRFGWLWWRPSRVKPYARRGLHRYPRLARDTSPPL